MNILSGACGAPGYLFKKSKLLALLINTNDFDHFGSSYALD